MSISEHETDVYIDNSKMALNDHIAQLERLTTCVSDLQNNAEMVFKRLQDTKRIVNVMVRVASAKFFFN